MDTDVHHRTQSKNQNWKDFFALQEKHQVEKAALETPTQFQAHLQRQKNPAIKKAKVFTWVACDEDPS